MQTITILENNFNSDKEAKEFAKFVESKGHIVDFRTDTSGNSNNTEEAQKISNQLWDEFCNA